LLTNGIVACEDGSISFCTNGLEDLDLPCYYGEYKYFWRVYVTIDFYGTSYSFWANVTDWVELGPCPTIPVADFFIDQYGYLPPDFTASTQIAADPDSTGQPLQVLIEGAAICSDDYYFGDFCFASNGTEFLTDVDGVDRTVISVTYYPAGSIECDIESCTQTINLNPGWNLISLDVSPADNSVQTVFADLVNSGNLEFITSFDAGTQTFDPTIPGPFNSLQEAVDGFGYWVKVQNAAVLTV